MAIKSGRHISYFTATSFIVASMIGTGVFTSLGYQLLNIQSIFSLLILWIIGGFIALTGSLTYGELGTVFPRSGGEYHLLGRVLHPSIGFAAGVVSATVGFTAPAVLAAIALGNYFNAVIPNLDESFIAFFVIMILHLIHMTSIKWGTIFQDISTIIKIGLIIVFIGFGFLFDNPQKISIYPNASDFLIIMSPSFAIGLVWVSYAYTGWNSVIYIASEISNPRKNITRTMVISTLLVMLLYVLLNYIFLYSTPMDLLTGQVEIGYIAGIQIFGEFGGLIMSGGISIILLSTISSYVYIGPRIMQIMGEDHWFLSLLKHKNSNNIPINAFWLQLILSIFMIFTSSFEQILMYAGISLIMTTTLTVLSLFVLRYKEPELKRPYKVLGYPIVPLTFLVVNLWILYYSFLESIFESLMSLGIITISIIGFNILKVRR